MYKIAIIDDEMYGAICRKDYYEKMFGADYEIVKYISTPQEINEAAKVNVHAYIIDLIFAGAEYEGITFDSIIEDINEKKRVPIILVTSKWETFKQPNIVGKICKFPNIVMCLDWESISDGTCAINQMRQDISGFYRHTSIEKAEDDKITLLHLSDLQFGDNNTDPLDIFTQYDISTRLRDNNKIPDILLITGDVASHGKRNEYEMAYEWLSDFAKNLWGNNINWGEKIVIVPGNHDVDYSSFIPNEYDWDYEAKEGSNICKVKKIEHIDEYNSKAMLEFAHFMRRISGDFSYLDEYDNLFRVNERFLNWGIRFYEFNTARDISPLDPQKVCIHSEDYTKLMKSTVNIDNTHIFNVVVSHYGPESLGFRGTITERMDHWTKMRGFVETSKVNMMCSGHLHKSEIRRLDDKGPGSFFSKQLIVSTASTCSLGVVARPQEENRGFNVWELEREKGVVINAKGFEYKFNGSIIVNPSSDDIFIQSIRYE